MRGLDWKYARQEHQDDACGEEKSCFHGRFAPGAIFVRGRSAECPIVTTMYSHHVATTQLALGRRIEHGEISGAALEST
jgi:hypothetical protein